MQDNKPVKGGSVSNPGFILLGPLSSSEDYSAESSLSGHQAEALVPALPPPMMEEVLGIVSAPCFQAGKGSGKGIREAECREGLGCGPWGRQGSKQSCPQYLQLQPEGFT